MDTSKHPIGPRLGSNQIDELAPSGGAPEKIYRAHHIYHERFIVGGEYKRTDIARLTGYAIDTKYAEGIEIIPEAKISTEAAILPVTLDKSTIDQDYNDQLYLNGKRFRWDSQNRDDRSSPRLKLIEGGLETLLFCRLSQFIRSNITRPHTYCGRLKWLKAFDKHPVKVDFSCLDHVANPQGSLAELYSWESPFRID